MVANWQSGVIGAIGEKWDLNLQADIGMGGFEGSWQAQMFFQRKLQSGNAVVLGFRYMNIDFEDDLPNDQLFRFDASVSGLMVGFTWD